MKEIIKKDINKYETKKGLEILGYLSVLLSYSYEKENIFASILKEKIDDKNVSIYAQRSVNTPFISAE